MARNLFLSRGRGWGHCIRDIEIASRISKKEHNNLVFASYGAGCQAFRAKKVECYELDCDDNGNVGNLLNQYIRVISDVKPEKMIVDEEYLVLPIAKGLHIPCCYITNYLSEDPVEQSCIDYSEMVLFAEYDDMIQGTSHQVPIIPIGPVYQELEVDEIKPDSSGKNTVLVLVGGSTENKCRIANYDLVKRILEAKIPGITYRVVGEEIAAWIKRASSDISIEWCQRDGDIHKLISGCCAAIVRGGINTMWEMAALGIPSLSIPYPMAVNKMEVHYAKTMEKRGLVRCTIQSEITPDTLKRELEILLLPQQKIETISNYEKYRHHQSAAVGASVLEEWLST